VRLTSFANLHFQRSQLEFSISTQSFNVVLDTSSSDLGVTVNRKNVALPSGGVAAINTGATIVGGPAAAVSAIDAQTPNPQPQSGNLVGFYEFRMLVFLLARSLLDIPLAP